MRAGTHAGIFMTAPINQIMPALRARAGMIGNLVGRQAESGANILGHIIEGARHRLVRRFQLARGMQAEKRACRVRW